LNHAVVGTESGEVGILISPCWIDLVREYAAEKLHKLSSSHELTSEKADNLWTTGALCIAAKFSCLCRFWGNGLNRSRGRTLRLLAKKLIQETDFYGSQLLIHKLPTTITAATITAIADATITAATINDATINDATITAATARRRRRRNVDSTAAAAAAVTGVVPTATAVRAAAVRATPNAATVATRTDVCRTIDVALCFSIGGNGGSSECESRCEHGGYPA
jgi:hypothetical protein